MNDDALPAPPGGPVACGIRSGAPEISTDLTPRAGQSNDDIIAWMTLQKRARDVAVRLYAVALYKDQPKDDVAAEFAWKRSLTPFQQLILVEARRAKERAIYQKKKGAPVRRYRRNAQLTDDQKREEAAERKRKSRAAKKADQAAQQMASEERAKLTDDVELKALESDTTYGWA